MFSKIFISTLLLTCVYTYMIKLIKDKNDPNFQKLPDNFNFEFNGIQTLKPNLKVFDYAEFIKFLSPMFGDAFVEKLQKHYTDFEKMAELFNKDVLQWGNHI